MLIGFRCGHSLTVTLLRDPRERSHGCVSVHGHSAGGGASQRFLCVASLTGRFVRCGCCFTPGPLTERSPSCVRCAMRGSSRSTDKKKKERKLEWGSAAASVSSLTAETPAQGSRASQRSRRDHFKCRCISLTFHHLELIHF